MAALPCQNNVQVGTEPAYRALGSGCGLPGHDHIELAYLHIGTIRPDHLGNAIFIDIENRLETGLLAGIIPGFGKCPVEDFGKEDASPAHFHFGGQHRAKEGGNHCINAAVVAEVEHHFGDSCFLEFLENLHQRGAGLEGEGSVVQISYLPSALVQDLVADDGILIHIRRPEGYVAAVGIGKGHAVGTEDVAFQQFRIIVRGQQLAVHGHYLIPPLISSKGCGAVGIHAVHDQHHVLLALVGIIDGELHSYRLGVALHHIGESFVVVGHHAPPVDVLAGCILVAQGTHGSDGVGLGGPFPEI